MKRHTILSGEQLVAKGATKQDAKLPETGSKDVIPNGSWLEQKHIQAALEARRHLVEVERIEKSGQLSCAEWNEELGLAEVKQQVGGHWQYLGHNVGKTLYLKPEEALFLIEVNCLRLTYNDVTVSLQQAFALLLRGKITILQYKVYASLSRLGYKVFRHDDSKARCEKENVNAEVREDDVDTVTVDNAVDAAKDGAAEDTKMDVENTPIIADATTSDPTTSDPTTSDPTISDPTISDPTTSDPTISDPTTSDPTISDSNITKSIMTRKQWKLQKLRNGNILELSRTVVEDSIRIIPDMHQRHVVTLTTPNQSLLPENITPKNSRYVLNLNTLRVKASPTQSRSYSLSDEVNGNDVRRIRGMRTDNPSPPQHFWHPRFPRFPNFNQHHFFPYQFQRPRHMNQFLFNVLFQRPFLPNFNFQQPRPFPFQPRNATPTTSRQSTNEHRPRRRRNRGDGAKSSHFISIRKLSSKLKFLIMRGFTQQPLIDALMSLIQSYNTRYKTRLRLDNNFDLVDDEPVVETIEVEDDDAPSAKKSRGADVLSKYEEHLNGIKQLAQRLKEMETKGLACARHKRAFISMLKSFNRTYKAEVYLDEYHGLTDRSHIIIDSSDSDDCIVEEAVVPSKKLKNPFSILRKNSSGTENRDPPNNEFTEPNSTLNYDENLSKKFSANWLPSENDFGRAEIVPMSSYYDRITDTHREMFLQDFLGEHNSDFRNWCEVKVAFWDSIDDGTTQNQTELFTDCNPTIPSLVKPEDCTDMASVLEKLRIIPSNNDVSDETSLSIDFVVYKRDVQNFRKTNPPKPHFRILCVDENTSLPSGSEIVSMYAKYNDSVDIVFAVVGTGSISYLQAKSLQLPIYLPSEDV